MKKIHELHVHMDQIPQDGNFGQIVKFFEKSRAFVCVNLIS